MQDMPDDIFVDSDSDVDEGMPEGKNSNAINNENEAQKPSQSSESTVDVEPDGIAKRVVKGYFSSYLSIFTMGGGIGFVTGMATKKMGWYLFKTTIGSALIIQGLQMNGYLDIKWDKIKNDFHAAIGNEGTTSYFQYALANVSSICAGFGAGWKYG